MNSNNSIKLDHSDSIMDQFSANTTDSALCTVCWFVVSFCFLTFVFDLPFHLPRSISFTLFSLRYAHTHTHFTFYKYGLSRIFVVLGTYYYDTQMYVNLDKLLALKTAFHMKMVWLNDRQFDRPIDRSVGLNRTNCTAEIGSESDHFAHIEISSDFTHSHDDKMQSPPDPVLMIAVVTAGIPYLIH